VTSGGSFDTASFNTSTGVGIGGLTGTPVAFDAALMHANDAAFRAIIQASVAYDAFNPQTLCYIVDSTKVGTNPGNASLVYNDGLFPDLATLDTTTQYLGTQSYQGRVLGLNDGQSAPQPQMKMKLPGTLRSAWVWGRRRFPTSWTNAGNATSAIGTTFNGGGEIASVCTVQSAITAGTGAQTFQVSTTANMHDGILLTFGPGLATEEYVACKPIDATHLKVVGDVPRSSYFQHNHAIGEAVAFRCTNVYTAVATVNGAVTGSGTAQTIAVSTTASMRLGSILRVEPGLANQEDVAITIVDGTHVNGIFTLNHANGVSIDTRNPVAQSDGFKMGPHMGFNNGRFSWEWPDGDGRSSHQNTWSQIAYGDHGNIGESSSGGYNADEFYAGNWFDQLAHFEQWTGANGNAWVGVCLWIRTCGVDAGWRRVGYRRCSDTGQTVLTAPIAASVWPLNHNQCNNGDIFWNIWGNAVYDDTLTADPGGVLAYEKTLTPEACTLGAVSSQTASSATFPITLGRYGAYCRPVVDGTEQAAQEYAFPREQPELGYASNGTGTVPAFVLSRTVTGLSSGAHTISFNIYNGNKTASVNTGNQAVTI